MSEKVPASAHPDEYFLPYEIDRLKEAFPHQTATLDKDFESFELDVISNFAGLKNHPHVYLGMNKKLH